MSDSGEYKSVKCECGSGGKSEQFADDVGLTDHISIGHSAVSDHVRGLDPLQRPPRRPHSKMNDDQLLAYGRSGARLVEHGTRETWKVQLEEARAEWRRRHPRSNG